ATAGQIGILLLLPLSSFEAATALPAAAAQHARSQAAADRLAALVGPAAAPRTGTVPAPRTTAHLRAAGLTAGWTPQAPRVRGLGLDLPAGSRLAIVGASGSGKSTLLATLAGLLDALDGHVELDGHVLAALDPAELRAGVTMFAEDAHVFATTVRENLKVVRADLDDGQIRAALSAVGLSEWVDELPHGLDTMLGPDGTTVSGGERRRLLLARAVVRGGPVLLLDEPTEHLDTDRG